jgi:hypothetical protein
VLVVILGILTVAVVVAVAVVSAVRVPMSMLVTVTMAAIALTRLLAVYLGGASIVLRAIAQ